MYLKTSVCVLYSGSNLRWYEVAWSGRTCFVQLIGGGNFPCGNLSLLHIIKIHCYVFVIFVLILESPAVMDFLMTRCTYALVLFTEYLLSLLQRDCSSGLSSSNTLKLLFSSVPHLGISYILIALRRTLMCFFK